MEFNDLVFKNDINSSIVFGLAGGGDVRYLWRT